MSEIILKVENLSKKYIEINREMMIFKNISFDIKQGESLAIVGPSGCGKTSLLQIIGLMDFDYNGNVVILNKNIQRISEDEKKIIRQKDISFVHQFHHLFPEFSAIENIIIPQLNLGINKSVAINCAMKILYDLNLNDKSNKNLWQLSGGERQRIAMARAIINKPKLILADEPTGSLDSKTSEEVINLLINLCKINLSSLILVTHNNLIAKKCDNILNMF